MTTLYGGRDRAKASEHAVFLCRELPVPLADVTAALPRIAQRLLGKLWLDLALAAEPRVPIELALEPSLEASDWRVALRAAAPGEYGEFFEGDLRLARLARRMTHVTLLGRFTAPDRAVREENLARIFDLILHEIGDGRR